MPLPPPPGGFKQVTGKKPVQRRIQLTTENTEVIEKDDPRLTKGKIVSLNPDSDPSHRELPNQAFAMSLGEFQFDFIITQAGNLLLTVVSGGNSLNDDDAPFVDVIINRDLFVTTG